MEGDQPSTITCAVVAMDHTNYSYMVCSLCETTLSDNNLCKHCQSKTSNPQSSIPKRRRLFRILLSIATEDKVFVVICFDRAARALFGCSADKFFEFARFHPFAAMTAGKVLEGEMLQMTLSKPMNGNAQHLRAVSIVPLRSGFSPVIETLKEIYGVTPRDKQPAHPDTSGESSVKCVDDII